ncbi:hypothetical protein OCK74_27580 [Chitinophagaceae bacterium LB-8]|uniref:Uncharacterized protein n=1 Tax=Paraflavisolibacter caeni TaxID=2982496 RepID=A0A9X2Y1K0_9BACT|nr:hypothetical protein [Paraflavisolibacter caeni]MCU7552912.1 hypothetical protein [Paraflavisolibacter caeni]
MPFYRIVIWTRKRREPYTGIRQIDNYNIDAVQHIMRVKAEETYRFDFVDVEVQMISKVSTAVKKYLKELTRKREAKKWPALKPYMPGVSRKELYKNQEYIPLWQRVQNNSDNSIDKGI